MKLHSLVVALSLVALVACSKDMVTAPTPATPAAPAAPVAHATTVAILSQATGDTTLVPVAADAPLPPTCAWRDLVIKTHIDSGGRKNDIVTLANLHRVFIQDTFDGYRLTDYPSQWCTR